VNTLLVVDNPKKWPLHIPGAEVVAARDYLTDPKFAAMTRAKVFNLCRSYRYQAAGYYVSLLAAARGHKPLPSVITMQDLRLASIVKLASQELEEQMQRAFHPLKSDKFELSIYFGRNMAAKYDRLSLALFNQFPAPLLRATFVRNGRWRVDGIRVIGAADIPDEHHPFVIEQAQAHFARPRRAPKAKPPSRFDLAILRDPEEKLAPSDDKALKKFVEAGESLGIGVTFIGKDAFGSLAEYDALFIRETTYVNHHTYRFARRAVAEGLVVIDDPESILRCTNKVFLAELMDRHDIPTPTTLIFSKDTARQIADRIGFPCVIKQPDSAFSAGVTKIETAGQFELETAALFEKSDLLLAQEFVPTEFDWRVGVLGGEALFVCRYYMARRHWQIVKRDEKGVHEGRYDTMPVSEAPKGVIALATRAARLIGNGLYGVDLKVIGGRPKIIEINDNPNIDAGVEDRILGPVLYERIMRHFLTRLEERSR
jgi:glutathione synthase/RimK-type ligase-like ATP-grasp enzyme